MPISRIRSFARSGCLVPEGGRFGFQDLVLLRTAKGLLDARIPERRVKMVLKILKQRLPGDRPLSGVNLSADGADDLNVIDLKTRVASLAKKNAVVATSASEEMRAEDWFALALELEATSPEEARDAYRRTLELDPANADARVNLGRLLHEAGELAAAEAHYRLALSTRPDDATAMFDLGVVLEDQKRFDEAIHAYESAIALDATAKDAYWNLAQLCERLGNGKDAIRWLKAYKKLISR